MAKTKGKTGMVIVAMLIAIVAVAVFLQKGDGEIPTISIGGDTDSSVVIQCENNPTLQTPAPVDAQNKATSVTADVKYFVNGKYTPTAPSSYLVGDKVKAILNASGWIDILTDEVTMQCGVNRPLQNGQGQLLMGDYTAPTIEIKDDSTVLIDSASGGASNATAIASGGSDTFDVCFTGTDKDTTGDFVYIVELANTQNVSAVNMVSGSGVTLAEEDKPSFYTDTLTSPFVKAFRVPALNTASELCYKLTLQAKSGRGIAGAVYTTGYVGEPVLNGDGSIYSWAIEDQDGTADYEATFDEDFLLA